MSIYGGITFMTALIGIIGFGDMGKLYGNYFQKAGYKK
jgi:prephenate dehydrogenase